MIKPYDWQAAIKASETLHRTTKSVLQTLATYMGKNGVAFPSTQTLASATGFTERCICTHLEKAAQSGWLIKSLRGKNGQGWKRHAYTAKIPEELKIGAQLPDASQALDIPQHGTERDSAPISLELEKGTERRSARNLNNISKGTERHDKKALNGVQSNYPSNYPIKDSAAAPLLDFQEVQDPKIKTYEGPYLTVTAEMFEEKRWYYSNLHGVEISDDELGDFLTRREREFLAKLPAGDNRLTAGKWSSTWNEFNKFAAAKREQLQQEEPEKVFAPKKKAALDKILKSRPQSRTRAQDRNLFDKAACRA
jgi:hypothetical protein